MLYLLLVRFSESGRAFINFSDFSAEDGENPLFDKHAELIRVLADRFDNTYLLDFRKYAPVYDGEYSKSFRLGYHLNPMGYHLTALMVESYIDYIIRHNMQDFKQVGFIGTDYYFEEN